MEAEKLSIGAFKRPCDSILSIDSDTDNPWDRRLFGAWLSKDNVYGWAAKSNGQVLGFMIHRATERSVQIGKIIIRRDRRRQGLGRRLVDGLITRVPAGLSISAEVPEENLAAQVFLRELGFRAGSLTAGGYRMTYRCWPKPSRRVWRNRVGLLQFGAQNADN